MKKKKKKEITVARAEVQRVSMDNTHIRNLHNNIMQGHESTQRLSLLLYLVLRR